MAVAFRSVGVSTPAITTETVVDKPVGLAVGDLMIAHIVARFDITITAPDETWTGIRTDEYSYALSSYVWWKIADQDDVDASDFTFTHDSKASMGAISAWTGHDAITPINASNGKLSGGSATINTDAITPSVANCVLLILVAVVDDVTCGSYAITTSDPGSWAEAYDVNTLLGNDMTFTMAYSDPRPETTSTGNGTATISDPKNNIGQIIAIAPAAVVAAGRSFGFIIG